MSLRITTFVGAVFVLGCDADAASETEPKAPPVARADFCDTYAQTFCARVSNCCMQAGITPIKTACATNVINECHRVFAEAESKGSTYDGNAAGACIDSIRKKQESCERDWNELTIRDTFATCARIWVGTVAVGGHCDVTSECAQNPSGPVACYRQGTGSACTLLRTAAAGESCRSTYGVEIFCAEGLYCDDSGTGTCQPAAVRGEACDPRADYNCSEGLRCDPEKRICVAPAPIGGSCNFQSRFSCVPGAHCDAVGGDPMALACSPSKLAGESCNFDLECASHNCDLAAAVCFANVIVRRDRCDGSAFLPDIPALPARLPFIY